MCVDSIWFDLIWFRCWCEFGFVVLLIWCWFDVDVMLIWCVPFDLDLGLYLDSSWFWCLGLIRCGFVWIDFMLNWIYVDIDLDFFWICLVWVGFVRFDLAWIELIWVGVDVLWLELVCIGVGLMLIVVLSCFALVWCWYCVWFVMMLVWCWIDAVDLMLNWFDVDLRLFVSLFGLTLMLNCCDLSWFEFILIWCWLYLTLICFGLLCFAVDVEFYFMSVLIWCGFWVDVGLIWCWFCVEVEFVGVWS